MCEGSVLDDQLQVAIAVRTVAVGLPELNGLQFLTVLEGIGLNGDGLIVVLCARVVVDAHHTVVRLQVVVIGTHNPRVPYVLARVAQQAGTGKLLVVGVPVFQRFHQALMACVVVLQRLALAVAPIAIDGAVHLHVLNLRGIDADAAVVVGPAGVLHVARIDAGVYADAAVGALEGIGGYRHARGRTEDIPMGGLLISVHHHQLLYAGILECLFLDVDDEGGCAV